MLAQESLEDNALGQLKGERRKSIIHRSTQMPVEYVNLDESIVNVKMEKPKLIMKKPLKTNKP